MGKTLRQLAKRTDYIHGTQDGALWLMDMDAKKGMSLAANMRNVLDFLRQEQEVELTEETAIVYRDSQRIWDQVRWQPEHLEFIPLGGHSLEEALFMLRKLSSPERD